MCSCQRQDRQVPALVTVTQEVARNRLDVGNKAVDLDQQPTRFKAYGWAAFNSASTPGWQA